MKQILIIGACSAIAQETAKIWAKEGHSLCLSDLDSNKLNIVADDLISRGAAKAVIYPMDVNDFDKHKDLISFAVDNLGTIDVAFVAHGTLPDPDKVRADNKLALKEFSTNCLSVISLATILANYFEKMSKGILAVISSVAGDRGRQSNYLYGSAKGAVSLFLQGLRNRFGNTDIKIITLKPGMVDTPMTSHMKKGILFSSARDVGKAIHDVIDKGKDIAYIPSYWFVIMTIIKHIPEFIFKKLKL